MPTYDPADPYRPLFTPTLSQQKSDSLATRYAEKSERLAPTPVPDSTNLIDLGQASLLRAGGNLADTGRDISNYLFNTNFDSSVDSGNSNPTTADSLAGVSEAYRKNLQTDQHSVLENVAKGEYLEAAKSAGNVAFRTAADSFATLPEVAAGAVVTAATGGLAGPLVFGKKIKQTAEAAAKIKKEYEDATRLGKALKTSKNLPQIAAKAAGQASILTADLTQQQVGAYREKYGEDPSLQRVASMTLGVLATTIWEPSIIAKLFIPKFKQELVSEAKGLLKNLGEGSNLVNIGKRIGDGLGKVTKAGAAEAGQEYLQTWQEIFATEISPEQADNLWKAVASKIDDKGLRDQALTGGLLGAAAGGATRGAISAPAIAAGTTLDVTKATAKGTAKVAGKILGKARDVGSNIGNKTALKALSTADREVLRDKQKSKKVIHDKAVSALDLNIATVDKATTFEELEKSKNADIASAAVAAKANLDLTENQLKDPKNLKKVRNAMLKAYRGNKALIAAEFKANNATRVAAKIGKNVKDGAVQAAKDALPDVDVDAVLKTVKDFSDKSIEAVSQINSSAALGIVELAVKGGTDSSKKILTIAKDLELNDLTRAAKAIKEHNKPLGEQIDLIIEDSKKSAERFGQRNNDTFDERNTPEAVTNTAKLKDVSSDDAAAVSLALQTVLEGTISDNDTLSTVRTALEAYKESDTFKQQKDEDGAMTPSTMGVLENKLKNADARINRVKNTKEKVTTAAQKTLDTAKATFASAKETYDEVKATGVVQDAVQDTFDAAKATLKVAEKTFVDVKNSDTLKNTVDNVKSAANSAIDATSDAITSAENKINGVKEPFKGKAAERLGIVEKMVTDGPKDSAVVTLDRVAKLAKENGYETKSDIDQLLEQFPGIKEDANIVKLLKDKFPDSNSEVKSSNSSTAIKGKKVAPEDSDVVMNTDSSDRKPASSVIDTLKHYKAFFQGRCEK